MNRRAHSPFRNEYTGYSCLTDIKRTTPHRPPLFHSEGGHMELRVDFMPLISALVYQGLGSLAQFIGPSIIFSPGPETCPNFR